MGSVQFQQSELFALVGFIMKGPPEPMGTQGTSQASAPVFTDDRPEIKLRMERNLQEIERLAKVSSQWPNTK